MIHLTNSIFKTAISCPARCMAMYKGRMTGDPDFVPTFVQDGSKAMPCGSLVDAMVTKGYSPDIDADIAPEDFYGFLKSSYDDGMKNATWLCNKSTKTKKGGWNADAKTAIKSAERLMADPVAKDLIDQSEKQVKIAFNLDEETVFSGDIDLLQMDSKTLRIIDLKSPGKLAGGWIVSGGKNLKVSWEESWNYPMQLMGYRYGFQNARETLLINGVPLADTKYARPFCIDTGLLVTTREVVPMVKYIPIPDYGDWWRAIIKGRMNDGSMSNLEAIKRIVKGEIEAPRCGDCEFCRPTNKVVIEESTSFEGATPAIDDIYGYLEIDDDNIYANEF